jgi:DMSO reductase anchor subunit
MHPAYSVILFTTASGAGYGLLVLLALIGSFGVAPISQPLAFAGFFMSFGLIATGLLSSTFHLGRPERAWRAFSQWPSSWLSREGVAAVVTFVPAGLLAISWVFTADRDSALLALASAAMALVTVFCTGMIYASLPTIRQWHNPFVTPIYLMFAIATGAALTYALLVAGEVEPSWFALATAAVLMAAGALKLFYWQSIDNAPKTYTVESATGLGRMGAVRPVEPAHTQPNFVMREMGYSVARTHVLQLRKLALAFGFLLPALMIVLSMMASTPLKIIAAVVAAGLVLLGAAVERWLFFAEAEHVVTLYYGARRA